MKTWDKKKEKIQKGGKDGRRRKSAFFSTK
jgi:hypothetical protein